MHAWLKLSSPNDLDQLESLLAEEFDPHTVIEILKKGITGAVKAVLIEDNYVDKDYRSTYYGFYSKHGQRYNAGCVRLHFFDSTVEFDKGSLKLAARDDRLTDHYFGYMVLRPTGESTIGRTVLSPRVRTGASQNVITSTHKAHVLGYKLMVEGFPWMNQHVDIAVCAHTACWSILRHYSERWSSYREFLTHDITLMAHDFDPGGLLPSRGLEVGHAERVFHQAGTFPIHVPRASAQDRAFFRQLLAYVDSGFPVFAAMQLLQHAIVVIGYDLKPPSLRRGTGLRYAWDEVASLSVVDDNDLPYVSIPVGGRAGHSGYTARAIDAFIVALPEKVFYPADAVELRLLDIYSLNSIVALPAKNKTTIRYFITTASSLRSFVRDHASEFAPTLLATIMELPFAQFLWIVEYSTREQWARGQVEARAVLDATASVSDHAPLWLLHNRTRAVVFDRQTVSRTPKDLGILEYRDAGHAGFSRIEQNLRPAAPAK